LAAASSPAACMKAASFFVGACLLAAVLPVFVFHGRGGDPGSNAAIGSVPAATRDVAQRALQAIHYRGGPLTPQPVTALEARFASSFPGVIARYRAGDATVIVRRVMAPTRQLHPAADCFRAAGYALGGVLTYADATQSRWNCFEATQGGQRWRVCER